MSTKPPDVSSTSELSEKEADKLLPQASTNAATNLCVICSTRERAVVFVPCGHLIACVPCGHGLKSCPTCGTNIKALVRVFT